MITGLTGLFFGFLSGVFLLVGLLPFLGWLNWLTSLPLAGLGMVFAVISARGKFGRSLGTAATVICSFVIVLALFRLHLGWGIL